MNNILKEETRDIKNVLGRFRKRDFSGTTGQVIKNSTYNLATSLIAKLGSLIFTVIIARMIGVELFGLYILALSTITLFSVFSDLGLSSAMLTFSARALAKNKFGKAKTYFKGLLKYKIYLAALCSFGIITFGYILTKYYYAKPIYYALLAGAIYIPIVSLMDYINTAFCSGNNFRAGMIKEIIFQILRLSLVPLGIFFLLKTSLENSIIIAAIILILVFCYFAGLLYLRIIAKKQIPFLRERAKKLTQEEKKDLKKFILPITFTALSGMFFGYIDMLMLGHYVDITYIGHYGATFGLIGSASAIISFASTAVLPVFSRLKGESLEKTFRKVRNFTLLIGILSAIFTYLAAKYILMIYGQEFVAGTILLQIFSLLLIILPIAGIYSIYFTSLKKTKILATLLIFSTLANIILNVWFIAYGLQFSMMYGVVGACVATICSRLIHLAGLIYIRRNYKMQ
jgi:O-antigen/teichoic acid export membrane protein